MKSDDFQPVTRRYALASRVLAVAQTRVEGVWTAYVDAVPGLNHEIEQDNVLRVGAKLRESVARAMFPEFKLIPYAK